MNIYTIVDARVMGDADPKYGYTLWATVEEIDQPVMFNSKNGNVMTGQQITAENATQKVSAKGIDYLRLSKVKVSGSGDSHASSTPTIKEGASSATAVSANAVADSKFLKDVTDMRYRVWTKLIPLWDSQSLHKNAGHSADFWEAVDYHTNELLEGIEKQRNPKEAPPATASTGYDKFKEAKKKLTDEEDWTQGLTEEYPDD